MRLNLGIAQTVKNFSPTKTEVINCKWLKDIDLKYYVKNFLSSGITKPLLWYKVMLSKKEKLKIIKLNLQKSIDIPSVLVESGFLTNPEDAERLKGKPGRRMIARSIFLGIHNYFLENPIKGTFVEKKPLYVNYEIQKGTNH